MMLGGARLSGALLAAPAAQRHRQKLPAAPLSSEPLPVTQLVYLTALATEYPRHALSDLSRIRGWPKLHLQEAR